MALLLGEMVGPTGHVACLDPSEAAVQAARTEIIGATTHSVTFEAPDMDAMDGYDGDLVYSINLFAVATDAGRTGARLARTVPTDGKLILEEMDLRGAGSEPPSPAVKRWIELRAELMRFTGGQPEAARQAVTELASRGFDLDDVEVAQPAFANGSGRHLPVAEFEAAQADLVASGLIDPPQARELLHGLRREAAAPNGIVFWPRLLLVRATKVLAAVNSGGLR